MRFTILFALALALGAHVSVAEARTWIVRTDGTGDAATIQMGIDFAAAGDTVLLAGEVFTGTGNWNLDLHGKAITVRSEGGDPAGCTIGLGGLYAHRGFRFHSGEGPDSRIEGLTIADGSHSQGAGILVQNASPTVVDCRILRCVSQSDGGGVSCTDNASPVFIGCTIAENDAYFYGGGIRLELGTEVELSACTLRSNTAVRGGGIYSYGGTVALEGCVFLENVSEEDGGAIYLHGDDGSVLDCVFARNAAETGWGGAVYCGNSSPRIGRCTFWGNAADVAGGIHCRIASHPLIENTIIAASASGCALYAADVGYEPVLTCCDLHGNPGGDWIGLIADQYGVEGNISADPLFCDPHAGDLTLAASSPCLPGNHPDGHDCGLIGALGHGCSGPISVEQTTWGGVKARFR
ncbi:MAG: right-handed parallel beta-helix repeat-containing protein [Candidatus Eisenbacteria bacterium]